ncbi:putative calcium-transporting ATPase 13, plasma membrane-type [Olea europaea var. sylvestris]|uniref:putative calcium-transporting ATPase 13, plasma membrane-type n=1 Tax=Olea europaea var. sylvestris TaxID=158386 RepID=UPI000C1D0877|nr:putative calcium-transporting ATPase 13, plasma membrane-type [Olea europaea var. sylvestris]
MAADSMLNCDNPAEVPTFGVNQECLAILVQVNDSDSLRPFGGMPGLMAALETNAETGISGDAGDLCRRHKAFGSNLYLEEQTRPVVVDGFFRLALQGFKDTTIILLLCCALLSAVIGIKRNGPVEGLRDGVIVVSVIFFALYFGLLCRFIKSRIRRRRLLKNKIHVRVVRHGKMTQFSDSEVVVGDIVCLQAGNQVPADGLFIEGNSSFKLDDDFLHGDSSYYKNPSLFTGAKVKEGNCQMLVLSVGKNTERSRMMRSLSSTQKIDNQESKLQISIDNTSSRLEKIWLSLSLFILVVQLFRCFLYVCDDSYNPDPKGVKNSVEDLVNGYAKRMKKQGTKASGLVAVLSILLFALRDGLPLGIFVSFVYASNKMKSHGAIVRRLPSCATIGLVTTICTGITNDLALHHSRMADLWIGFDSIKDVSREVAGEVLQILQDGFCAYASCNGQENALCYWAHQMLDIDMFEFNTSCAVLDINKSPDLNKNSCGLVLKKHKEAGRVLHIHCNGEFEKMLSMCSHYCKGDGTMQTLDEDKKDLLNREFQKIASNCLQVLAFAYKEINREEENGEIEEDDADDNEETLKLLEHGLIFLALVSLKNPYAPEMRQAIQDCRASGVAFKLVVDTDVTTARIIALYSGILRPEEDIEGAITEASDFLKKDQEERLKTIENIHVIANTFPTDRLQFVQCLKQKNKVVALAGSCIRDCPSLIEADVGIFMGSLRGAEDADIVVLNQNISPIFTIIKLGRFVQESIKKFTQLQLTLNITAFTVNFVFVIARREVQILPFQVLWINVIMDVLGALALAIRIVELQGESGVRDAGDPIMNRTMWRNVAVQSLFQITILIFLQLKGTHFFHEAHKTVLKSMINCCYVFCQIFGLITAMIMFKKKTSMTEELFAYRKCLLIILGIVGIIVVLEVGLLEIMATVAHWGKLNSKEWCFCIGIAALSVPIVCAAN